MKYKRADHIAWAISNSRTYYRKGRGLEVHENQQIHYNGNLVGYVVENWDVSDYMYVVLTAQTFLLPAKSAKSLIHTLNDNDIKVVFLPIIDIGFGLTAQLSKPNKVHYKDLLRIAKYAQDDVKTAIVLLTGLNISHPESISQVYTFNQLIGNTIYHAEDILIEYLQMTKFKMDANHRVLMDLEPCYHCLTKLIKSDVRDIRYVTLHKDKWDTDDYLNLVDRLNKREFKTKLNYPILYKKEVLK